MAALNDPVLVLRMANSITNLIGVCKHENKFIASSKNGLNDGIIEERFEMLERTAKDLSFQEKEEIYQIFEANMSQYYLKTWGLKKDEKMNEMFHWSSRLFCLYNKPSDAANGKSKYNMAESEGIETRDNERAGAGSLAAFTIFRFEWDDDEEPEYPVLYCYELQVHSAFQGRGLGRKLMEVLATTAKQLKMEKVMLTCFNINDAAMKFYNAIGYELDENSPTKSGFPADYEILSLIP